MDEIETERFLKDLNELAESWENVEGGIVGYTKVIFSGCAIQLRHILENTFTPAPSAQAVVRAAKELRQVWTDKGHGGNAEVEAHRKLAKAVDALAVLEAGRK